MIPLFTGSRVLIILVEHYIAANFVDIKFGDFVQNTILFYLVSFKFGDLGPRLPNVTSLLQCQPS